MQANSAARIQHSQKAIPWKEPIRVQFACDDRPLFGCRLCILMFGLRPGDHERLFPDQAEALRHICRHVDDVAFAGMENLNDGPPRSFRL